ncbi:MAG: hypothetical protein GC203_15280 [Phenylobacterium sp.]|uniref:hypothetical protein n=1 Tax=Phenylobacterium sp. TaxID=1871053 RepID=UPI0025D4CB27|nr:hypothetical protein [Phenylobacterium sp.]MBI1199221.1 hypothetical protein [Phenylobacterium sp.]
MNAVSEQPPAPAHNLMEMQAREALCIWECACGAWTDYLSAVSASPTPASVMEANTKLAADTWDIYGRAAGLMLSHGGLRAPLLSDG